MAETKKGNARTAALRALTAMRRSGAWSQDALNSAIRAQQLDERDAALATSICLTVLRNRILIDEHLSVFSARKLSDLQPVVLDILRIAACQLEFMDRIPASAAVNEAVDQTKRSANPKAAGYVNGVLRAMARGPLPALPDPGEGRKAMSVRWSHPEELTELLAENVPPELLPGMLEADNRIPLTALQVNESRIDSKELLSSLRDQPNFHGEAEIHPWLPGCVCCSGLGDPERLEAFRDGLFWVQDPAARLVVQAMELRSDMRVLDACAAPGGKSFAAALAVGKKGNVLSCDIHKNKLHRIRSGAQRLGFDQIETALSDASVRDPSLEGRFDAVILDVPCSGYGVIAGKPEIRYKAPSSTEGLPSLQKKILENRCGTLRPGGVLMYSTCTVLKRENEEVARSFLAEHPEFRPEPIVLPGIPLPENDGMLTLYPGGPLCTDGFFLCRMRKAYD